MGKFAMYCMPVKKVMQLWFTRLPAVKDEVFPVTGDWDHDEGTATCPQGSATTLAALSDSEEDKLAPLTSGSGGEKRKNSDTDRRARGSVCEAALLRGVPINGDEEDSVCVVPRPVEENVECQIGGMVFSSTCCVVLVIFALLFVLAGSVLAFIVYHQVDVRVIKFLTNYNYLKVASPLMICLGLVMLLFGTVFWIAKRKRKPRCVDYTNQSPSHVHPDSYFSPTDISPTPRSSTAARGRGSLSSGADNQESVIHVDCIMLGVQQPSAVSAQQQLSSSSTTTNISNQQQMDPATLANLLVHLAEPVTCAPGVRDSAVQMPRCQEDAIDER